MLTALLSTFSLTCTKIDFSSFLSFSNTLFFLVLKEVKFEMNSLQKLALKSLANDIVNMFKFRALESYADASVIPRISDFLTDLEHAFHQLDKTFFSKLRWILSSSYSKNCMTQRLAFLSTIQLLLKDDQNTLAECGFTNSVSNTLKEEDEYVYEESEDSDD